MLANNRFFGISAATRVSGLAPSPNGLLMFQVLARQSGGYGKTAAVPRGYGSIGLAWPARAGEMAADLDAKIRLTAVGTLIATRAVEGAATLTLGAVGDVTAVASVAGTATITLAATGSMQGLAEVAGTASLFLSATGNIGARAAVAGVASIVLSASATMGATAAVAGTAHFSGAAEGGQLTEAGIVNAVWRAAAATYNEPGTMGNKVNTASSGGVDLNALAAAVWAHTVRGLTTGGAPSAAAVAAAVRSELAIELARVDAAITTRVAGGATVPADVRQVNGVTITGAGVPGNSMRPA